MVFISNKGLTGPKRIVLISCKSNQLKKGYFLNKVFKKTNKCTEYDKFNPTVEHRFMSPALTCQRLKV